MKEEEIKNFWKLDDKIYLVSKNVTYNDLFRVYQRNNSDLVVQEFINKLISWYFVKFSDKYIALFFEENFDIYYCKQVKTMSFDKLLERIDDFIYNIDTLYFQYLVTMAGWGLIYSKNTNPKFGFFRVKEMFFEFNSYYNWNLNSNIYKSILEYDYSKSNSDILKFIDSKNNNFPRKKSKLNLLMKIKNKLPKK